MALEAPRGTKRGTGSRESLSARPSEHRSDTSWPLLGGEYINQRCGDPLKALAWLHAWPPSNASPLFANNSRVARWARSIGCAALKVQRR